MSAGCVHQKASVILASGFLLGSFAFGNGIEYAAGALVGILLTPDLDVDKGFLANSIIRNKIGKWAEMLWNGFWYFYKKSLKHGGPLSHVPVVSTMFRLFYIYFFLIVIPLVLMEIVVPNLWDIRSELFWWLELGARYYKVILGLIGSDFIHWGLDILTTEHAKRKKMEVFGMPLASSTCK